MKQPKSTKTNSPDTTMIAVWVPRELARKLDAEAKAQDLDRSKLVRRALRSALRQPA